MVCTGYAGCESYDLVLYIARTITKLNYRVLIIDLSESGALRNAMKHGMDLDSKEEIINYRDINYTRKIPAEHEMKQYQEGVIFMVYGRNYIESIPLCCNQMNIITNTVPNIIDEVNKYILKQKITRKECEIRLLIRDVITLDDVDRVTQAVTLTAKCDKISYLYHDLADYESAVECQITKVVRFTKISSRMEKYITEQVHDMLPNVNSVKIKKAMAAARRGV